MTNMNSFFLTSIQPKINSLCMGNIDEKSAEEVSDVVTQHFLKPSRPLSASDTPRSKSLKLPTREEAVCIFGSGISGELVPIKFQELAHSSSEENNAVEMTFQAGSDLSLGYEGVGILDLISHMAYNSAFNQLRTKEQLGYIVSASTRTTAGSSWGLTVIVQSSSASPKTLEERIEAWMKVFRQELEEMPAETIAMEANGMVGQLLEENTKLSQEVGTAWSEIAATETRHEKMATPAFDRYQKLADELMVTTNEGAEKTVNGNIRKTPDAMKQRVLEFFDRFYAADASERRVLSSRVYNHASKAEYESSLTDPGVLSSYSDIRYLKEFMSSWPTASYWRVSGSETP
jgi:secreted Zn-dependent insulinase-like peptidase